MLAAGLLVGVACVPRLVQEGLGLFASCLRLSRFAYGYVNYVCLCVLRDNWEGFFFFVLFRQHQRGDFLVVSTYPLYIGGFRE